MNVVRRLREAAGLTQAELAAAAGTSQPTVAAYESGGKVPNLRTLRRLAASTGLEVHVTFVPSLTREDRRSLALHESIARRLAEEPSRLLGRARANLRKMRESNPGASELLAEWDSVLNGSVDEVVAVMTDPGTRSRELRQVTPFAGVLEPAERSAVYRQFRRQEARR